MGFDAIHETVVSDILDAIKDGIKIVDGAVRPKSKSVSSYSSLSRATSALTLSFPVLCSDSLPIDIATMVAKAIERKNVSLLQLAFSAYNITNAQDAVSYVSKFHQNIDMTKLKLDDFMDAMESLGEGSMLDRTSKNAVLEDCKRNLNFILDDSINETSLLEYSEINTISGNCIIKEAKRSGNYNRAKNYKTKFMASATNNKRQNFKDAKRSDNYNRAKNDKTKLMASATDSKRQYFISQLLSSDVRKANEMQPTMMLVNCYVNDNNKDLNIAQEFVVGIKSKLYPVKSADVINKIITKHVDGDIMLKLVKVSTREISFVKDLLLGLDDAKLSALSKGRNNTTSKLFGALERRALNGKIRSALRMNNAAKAISTLVISREEAEEIDKYENIDIMKPNVIIPIMEKLNLLYFVVVDTTAETLYMLTDGETEYEAYSFTALERDASDTSYKKIVNLITKMV